MFVRLVASVQYYTDWSTTAAPTNKNQMAIASSDVGAPQTTGNQPPSESAGMVRSATQDSFEFVSIDGVVPARAASPVSESASSSDSIRLLIDSETDIERFVKLELSQIESEIQARLKTIGQQLLRDYPDTKRAIRTTTYRHVRVEEIFHQFESNRTIPAIKISLYRSLRGYISEIPTNQNQLDNRSLSVQELKELGRYILFGLSSEEDRHRAESALTSAHRKCQVIQICVSKKGGHLQAELKDFSWQRL